jgi:hypothetical protein
MLSLLNLNQSLQTSGIIGKQILAVFKLHLQAFAGIYKDFEQNGNTFRY